MNAPVSILPKGTQFARIALALARGAKSGLPGARQVAEDSWGVGSVPAAVLRTAVTIGSMDGSSWGDELAQYSVAAAEFIEAMRPATILGKMQGMRRVPFRTRLPRATTGSTVGWVGERSPKPVSAMALDMIEMDFYQCAGIVVSSQELTKLSSPSAEGVVRADLIAATAALVDNALIDPDNAGEAGVSPASITYGATQISSIGTTAEAARQDLRALVDVVFDAGIDMTAPYFITSTRVASGLAFLAVDSPLFENVTIKGGSIAGVPLVVSSSVPTNLEGNTAGGDYESSITLVDAAEMLLADENGASIDMSGQATLEMNSAPDSPVSASTTMVSLWQENLVSWRVVKPVNWLMRRSGAVAVLTGVSY